MNETKLIAEKNKISLTELAFSPSNFLLDTQVTKFCKKKNDRNFFIV